MAQDWPSIQLELEAASNSTIPGAKVRVQLDREQADQGRWRQVYAAHAGQPNGTFPAFGFWSKDDGTGGTSNGSVWLAPGHNDHRAVIVLNSVFPAATGKRGSGYFIADAGYTNKGPVNYSILTGEQVTSLMPKGILPKIAPITDPRVQQAWCVAIDDLQKDGYLEKKYVDFLKDWKNWALIAGFWGMQRVRTKAQWFLILRTVATRALLFGAAVKYAGLFQDFYNKAQSATTDAEVEAAGHQLGDALASLIVDIGVAVFCAILDQMMAARVKGPASEPEPQPTIPTPNGVNLRDWRKAIPELYRLRNQAVRAMKATGDPKVYGELAQRAMGVNILIRSLSRYIVDTIHHIEMVKGGARHANELIRSVIRDLLSARDCQVNEVIAATAHPEYQFTLKELNYLAAEFRSAHRSGQLKPLDIDFHDFAAQNLSKFFEGIARALSSPMQVPRNLSLKELELLAAGKDPLAPHCNATSETYARYFGEKLAEWRNYFGKDRNVAAEALKLKRGIAEHNEDGHHAVLRMAVKPFQLLFEMGLDEAHGFLLQLRHYRDRTVDIGDALATMPEWKRAWVKLGLGCMYRLMCEIGPERVCDPRTLPRQTLRAYGQPELVEEFDAVLPR